LIRSFLIFTAMLTLAGCGSSSVKDQPGSPADLCIDTMRRAFPDADFDITKATAKPTGLAETEAVVEATREDAAPSAVINTEVAASCRFDHNVLVDFHWTKSPIR
jgi:hypothetical protein